MILLLTRNSQPWSNAAIFWNMRASFGKHSYGTPKKWLEEVAKKKGTGPGAGNRCTGAPPQVKQKLPESVAIFILPPSREELEAAAAQVAARDADEEIARRLARARERDCGIREILRLLCGE